MSSTLTTVLTVCWCLASCCLASGAGDGMKSCGLKTEGATFDLSDMRHKAADWKQSYMVEGGDFGCTPEKEEEFRYFFNVCEDVVDAPASCLTDGKHAPVLQTKLDGSDCHVAGTFSAATKVELIDASNPALGVKLNYTGGSRCQHGRQGQEVPAGEGAVRQTTLYFRCSRDRIVNPTTVFERNIDGEMSHCEYDIDVSSMYACPKECPISGRDLCAGHGICDWDKTNDRAKCFCDSGWSGDDCATEGDGVSSVSSTTVGLLVTLLIITLGLIGALVFMAKQVRAYRNDATNYMAIRSQEMNGMDISTI